MVFIVICLKYHATQSVEGQPRLDWYLSMYHQLVARAEALHAGSWTPLEPSCIEGCYLS